MDPDWSKLQHAYGSAEDLPDLLAELEPGPGCPAWGELWGRVCHQGTTYSASPYVLPYLAELAAEWAAPGQVGPLFLASSIVASKEFSAAGFEETIDELRFLADELLRIGRD